MPSLPENETAIEDLQRRVARANVWRWVFLLLMPVGFIAPCFIGIALGKSNPQVQGFTLAQAFGIAAFALPIVGFAGWLLMAGDRATYTTALAVAEQAESLGYRFSAQPRKNLMTQLRSFRMFEDADHHFGLNCVSGRRRGKRFSLLEYRTAYRAVPNPYRVKVNMQSVVIVEDLERDLPDFRAGPKTWLSKLLECFGARTIKLHEQQEFNRKFIVCGDDRDGVEQVLNPSVSELLLEAGGTVEVCGGSLLFYRHNCLEKPDDYPEMIELAVRLAKTLCTDRP
jgi:hypothetical protein